MEIPYTKLSSAALQGIIEEFILREGTEYGYQETTLADKVDQVMGQLRRGEVRVVFNPEDDSSSIECVPLSERRIKRGLKGES